MSIQDLALPLGCQGSHGRRFKRSCPLLRLQISGIIGLQHPKGMVVNMHFARGCPERTCLYFQYSAGSCFLPLPKGQRGGNPVRCRPPFPLQTHAPGNIPAQNKADNALSPLFPWDEVQSIPNVQ